MIPGYIVFLIFFVVLYASTNENHQLAATASALRDIWSGGCRLACCRSECRGLSGLGGTAADVSGHSAAGPSRGCVCEFCPCTLIGSVIRRCEPVTTAYATAVDTLSEFYYSILKTFAELYLQVQSTLECGMSCQRPARLLNLNTFDTDGNFNFNGSPPRERLTENENTKENERTIEKIRKKLSAFSKSDINLSKLGLEKIKSVKSLKSTKDNISGVIKQAAKELILDKKKSADLKAQTSNDSNADTQPSASTSSGNCPRCVEKGQICVGTCPKANVDGKK